MFDITRHFEQSTSDIPATAPAKNWYLNGIGSTFCGGLTRTGATAMLQFTLRYVEIGNKECSSSGCNNKANSWVIDEIIIHDQNVEDSPTVRR